MIPFSDEELYYAVKNVLPQVSGYVNSHGGGITLLGVKDGVVYIKTYRNLSWMFYEFDDNQYGSTKRVKVIDTS
jgi:hypothetical protein